MVGLGVFLGASWLFAGLLDAVLDNAALVRWDEAIAAAVHARITPTGLRVMGLITHLGAATIMVPLAIAGVTVLWKGRRTLAIGWMAATAGGVALDTVLKLAVHRTRPVYGAEFLHGHSYSFPSGHAMGAMIGYGMLSYALTRTVVTGPARRALSHGVAAAAVLAVGVSRVYLGVHYPSDVLGGYAAGLAWLAVCVTGIEVTQRRGREAGG